MAPRDRTDCREVVRAPEHHELAVVVPGVHVEGVLLTRVEAGHRRVALASADPARGGAGRPQGKPDFEVRSGAGGTPRLAPRGPRREGELLAPDGSRLRLRVLRVLVEELRV